MLNNPVLNKKMRAIAKAVGKAYVERRKKELKMKTCPKCQFESVENGKCGNCGFELSNKTIS